MSETAEEFLSRAATCRDLAADPNYSEMAPILLDIAEDYEERARTLLGAQRDGVPHPSIKPIAE